MVKFLKIHQVHIFVLMNTLFLQFQSAGDSEKALQILANFTTKYPNESDFLMDWRQTRARILRQTSRKRYDTLYDGSQQSWLC